MIAPIARGPLNVNADDAAAVLAIALGADRLVFVSDVAGVIVGGEVASEISARDIIRPGRRAHRRDPPEAQAAVAAARQGVRAEVGATLVVA